MSKYLNQQDSKELVSMIKQFTPVVTGNLRSSVQFVRETDDGFIVVVGLSKTGMAGSNPANYAAYVNYGFRTNPQSKKLRRDYMFVEKACKAWGDYAKRVVIRRIKDEKSELIEGDDIDDDS